MPRNDVCESVRQPFLEEPSFEICCVGTVNSWHNLFCEPASGGLQIADGTAKVGCWEGQWLLSVNPPEMIIRN